MIEPEKTSVRGVCVKDGNILLIRCVTSEGVENPIHYVFPGGKVQDDESVADALVREVEKDTSIIVQTGKLFATLPKNPDDIEEQYYLCAHITGTPELRDEEKAKLKKKDKFHTYTPMWIPLSELENIILLPEGIKELILRKFSI